MEEGASLAVSSGATKAAGKDGGVLRAGIVGTGFIGKVHARSVLLAGGAVAGVAASSAERGAVAAAELGASRSFATAEELVGADDIDVVHVCAPNHLHMPVALAALEAGKHLVCEKPLALTADDAARLVAAAEDAGVVATVPFAYRYWPTVREARVRVRSGATGPLHLLQGGYLQDWLLESSDDNWRVEAERGGASRAFADIGSHWCDIVEFVSGQRITSLTARVAIAHPERVASAGHAFERTATGAGAATRPVATEDLATVLFETDTGASGSLVVSQVSAGRKNRLWFELSGADGALAFNGEEPESLWVGTRDRVETVPRDFDTLDPEAARFVTLPGGHAQGFHDIFEAFVRETYDAIRSGEVSEGLPVLADGLRTARITEAVLESARSRAWVEVPA